MVVDLEQLKKENYKEYRKIYRNQKLKSIEWYCDVCKNGNNNTARGKFMHLKTKKHEKKNHCEGRDLIEL